MNSNHSSLPSMNYKAQVATCVIVQAELLYMAYNSGQKARNLARVKVFIEDINVYFIDEETADIYAQFKAEMLERFALTSSRQSS